MSNPTVRSLAAKKAAQTVKNRKQFIDLYGEATFQALLTIVKNRLVVTAAKKRSLAAYKANLSRGTYSEYISFHKNGTINKDKLGLSRM
jgi:hypothetical protein